MTQRALTATTRTQGRYARGETRHARRAQSQDLQRVQDLMRILSLCVSSTDGAVDLAVFVWRPLALIARRSARGARGKACGALPLQLGRGEGGVEQLVLELAQVCRREVGGEQ